MEILDMFLDEPGTKKTRIAAIEDRSLAETRNENTILWCCRIGSSALFHGEDGIDFRMFHITLDHIGGRVPGVDVHGDNILPIIDDTQVAMMVLVECAFMDFAQIKDVHHTYICWCKNNMARSGILRK